MSGSTSGIKSDMQGRPLMLRDGRLAATNFTLNNTRFSGVPKPKFMFYVRFIRGGPLGQSAATGGALNWDKGVGFVLKTIDRPSVEFELQTLNQYNKKRVIQTKAEYQPISMKFHDTVDNKVFKVFEDYFRYHYGDSVNVSDTAWNFDITTGNFEMASGWGMTSNTKEANLTYYFSRVEVYQIYGGKYNQFDLIHPKISSFDPDELDYSGVTVGAEITMKMSYEGIIFRQNGADLSSKSDLITEMGLDRSGFFENFDSPISDDQISSSGVGTVLPEQFDANNVFRDFTGSSVRDIANNLISGQSVDLGSIFKGNFKSAVTSNLNFTGGFGNNLVRQAYNGGSVSNLAGSLGYNLLNTGTKTGFSDTNGNINPVQRGLGLFGL